ncbi:hypothetical protein NL676_034617 [Syzygium grande]|nr:hypothetical protein NL676_034617 [Syzygium grande]
MVEVFNRHCYVDHYLHLPMETQVIVVGIKPLLQAPVGHVLQHQSCQIGVHAGADHLDEILVLDLVENLTFCIETFDSAFDMEIQYFDSDVCPIGQSLFVYKAKASFSEQIAFVEVVSSRAKLPI